MKRSTTAAACLAAATLATACASTEVSNIRREAKWRETFPKADRVLVYDIAAAPEDVATGAAVLAHAEPRAVQLTADEIARGRHLGAAIAQLLVEEIQAMGLPAERATGSDIVPRERDVVIRGQFVETVPDRGGKRVFIGLSADAKKVDTHVEVYQITADGLRQLASAEIGTDTSRMPGLFVPITPGAGTGNSAVKRTSDEIAKLLSEGFVRHGWISPDMAKK